MLSLNTFDPKPFFQNAQEMVALLGSQGRLREVNSVWVSKLGWQEHELLAQSVLEFVHPEDRLQTSESLGLITSQCAVSFTHRFRCKDGSYRWLAWSVIGNGHEGYAIAHDISTQKNKEIFFDEMQSSAGIGSWRRNACDSQFLWSEESYRIHGLPLDSRVDDAVLLERYPLECRPLLKSSLQDCLSRGTAFELELPLTADDGSERYVRMIGHASRDSAGAVHALYGIFQDITVQAARHRENERFGVRLKSILAMINHVVWEVRYPDRQLVYLTENQAQALYERPASEFFSDRKMWLKVIHPDDQGTALNKDPSMLESHQPVEVTYRIIRPNGEIRWVRDRSMPLHDRMGVIVGFQGIASDITDAKEHEEYLKKFREIVELAQEGIWEVDAEGRTLYVNPRMAEMLEISPQAMLHKSIFDFLCPEQAAEARRMLTGSPGARAIYELKFRTASGGALWTSIASRIRLNASSRMISAVTMITDISRLKMREQELLDLNRVLDAERENLAAFIANMPAAAAMLDREMRYISHSNQWQQDYRLSRPSVVGMSHYDVFPNIPETWRGLHKRTLAGESFRSERELFTSADGSSQWLRWYLRPWYQGSAIKGLIIVTQNITSEVEAEEKIRREKEKFEAIAQNIPVMLFISRDESHFEWVNPHFEKLLDWSIATMEGRDMLHELYMNQDQQEKAKAMLSEEHIRWQTFLVRTRSGGFLHTRWATHRLSTGQTIGIGLDVTESVNDRQRIEQSEAEIRTLIESAPDHILRVDPSFTILYMNHISGGHQGDVVGKTVFDLLPKENVPYVKRMFFQAIETATPLSFEIEMPRKEGLVRYGNRIIPLLTPEGAVRELMIISQDITQQHQAYEKIRTLASLIEASQDIYLLCDPQGKPIYFNNAARHKLGWDDSIGSVAELVPAEVMEKYRREVVPFIKDTEQQWEGETEIFDRRHRSGVPVWQRIFCLKDEAGKILRYAMVATDLRQQKADRIRLIQTSKMATLGEMAGGIAHEINNPLAVIHAAVMKIRLELSRQGVRLPEVDRAIKITEETTLRIARITKGLRAYARDDSQEPMMTIAILDIVNDTLVFCAERIRNHGIELIVDPIDPTLQLECRPVQIAQILLNLLSNSFDAIEESSERWIRLTVQEHPRSFAISITDSGPGIHETDRDRIMDPFFTTKPVGKGTGLGLSIAKGIAQSHGGTLMYDQASAHTRFILELPKLQGDGEPELR